MMLRLRLSITLAGFLLALSCSSTLVSCSLGVAEKHAAFSLTLDSAKEAIQQGHLEEAQVILKKIDAEFVADQKDRLLGDSESEELITTWASLASKYKDAGKFAIAQPLYESALKLAETFYNTKWQKDIAGRLEALSREEKAESHLLESELKSKEQARSATGSDFRVRLYTMQKKHLKSDSFEKAQADLEPFLKEANQLFDKNNNEIHLVQQVLEELYKRFGKYDRCIAMYETHLKAFPVNDKTLKSGDLKSIDNARSQVEDLSGIVRMKMAQKRFDEAERYAKRDSELCSIVYGSMSDQYAQRLVSLGSIQVGKGNSEEAIAPYESAVSIFTKRSDTQGLVPTLFLIGNAYYAAMRYRESQAALQRVIRLTRNAESGYVVPIQAKSLLAFIQLRLGEVSDADLLNKEVLRLTKPASLEKYRINHLIGWLQTCLYVPERLNEVKPTAHEALKLLAAEGKVVSALNQSLTCYHCIAKAELHASQLDQALSDFQALAKKCSDEQNYYKRISYQEIGNCFWLKNDLKSAETYLRQAASLSDDDSSRTTMQIALAWNLLMQRKFAEAQKLFAAYKSYPGQGEANRTIREISRDAGLAVILREQGKEAQAKILLTGAIERMDAFLKRFEGVDSAILLWKLSEAAGKFDNNSAFAIQQKRLAKVALAQADQFVAKSPWRKKIYQYSQEINSVLQ